MTNIISLLDKLREQELVVATAESCTGGMIAATITDIAGSSDVFDRGFVTYSNQSKIEMLGVLHETLEKHGAVSEETCAEMLQGALKNSDANIAVATTGIAGPGGGSEEKPIGLVYIGISGRFGANVEKCFFKGNREEIRKAAVEHAFGMIKNCI